VEVAVSEIKRELEIEKKKQEKMENTPNLRSLKGGKSE
jgi:hypothetical protein